MQFLKIFRGLLVILIIAILLSINLPAQLSGFKVSAGLSTIEILGNNIARYPLIWDTPKGKIYGGSFDQSQNGFRLESIFALDTNEIFEIPVGVEYNFYSGREKLPLSDSSDIKFKHDVGVATFTLGMFYNFYEIRPFQLRARFYSGIDTRTSFVFQGRYESSINYSIDKPDVIAYNTKEFAVRFGAALMLGMTGDINEDVSVDFRGGLGILNLLGQDDERGELLTPRKKTGDYEEAGESIIYNFHFSMLIQFRI
ncbi:MAG: hypothetical protein V1779_10400 [bacterium]